MKNFFTVLLVVTCLYNCKENTKQEANNTVQEELTQAKPNQSNEWEVLFDGTNYNHWRGYNKEEAYPEWTIEDGAMKFTPGEKGGKNIITKEKYKNFILSLEWKISEKGNSGIFWSVFEDPKFKEAYATGPEIQVLDNDKHPDSFVGEGTHKAGSLYDMIKCPPEFINPAGEWNHVWLEIDHNKNQGRLKMNGKEVFKFPVHGSEWDTMIENSKFKGWEGFGKYHEGHIGLQDHGDIVWYRNIKIKKI
jgi:hypothetical protein